MGYVGYDADYHQSAPFDFKEGPAVNFPGYSEDE
jgi:hypothetical protein